MSYSHAGQKNNIGESQILKTLVCFMFLLIMAVVKPQFAISIEDTQPPELLSFEFSPTYINTTNDSVSVDVTYTAKDDLSGVSSDATSLYFCSLSSGAFAGTAPSMIGSGGINGIVTFKGKITFPQYSEEGIWRVAGFDLRDNAGNIGNYDLSSLGFRSELQVVSVADTQPPQLLSFTFSPIQIDTTDREATVDVTYTAKDDLSGVSSDTTSLFFCSPSSGACAGTAPSITGSGSNDGLGIVTFKGKITFPQYSEEGIWIVAAFDLRDNAVNIGNYDLNSLGFQNELRVVSVSDTQAPQLLSLDISPNYINTTNGSVTVDVTYTAKDNLSGVSSYGRDIYFLSPSGAYSTGAITLITGGGGIDGIVTFKGKVTFPQYSEEGIWRVGGLHLVDNAGNTGNYELISLGYETDVVNIPPGPDCIDSDGDGYCETYDICPSDPSNICTVAKECPCGIPQYVECVVKAGEKLLESGLITHSQRNSIISQAAGSQCQRNGN